MSGVRAIESLLFVASKPMTMKRLAELAGLTPDQAAAGIETLKQRYNDESHGVQIAQHGSSVQMVTNPMSARLVSDFLKDERSGELTRPALETLTIIAYRGPIPKAEIDLIRGVNCSLILRNLMVRGLVTAKEDKDAMATMYEISFDFLRHLGLRSVEELPNYGSLNQDERLQRLLRPVPPPAGEAATERPMDHHQDATNQDHKDEDSDDEEKD